MSMKTTRRRRAARAGVAARRVVLSSSAACGGGDSDDARASVPTELGENESKVSILAWPGYVEDGSNDPRSTG